MFIERLTLRRFRNYEDVTIPFAPGGAYITGPNGSGKTNLLEAIYSLANLASFRTSRREELQGWGATQCMVGATVVEREAHRHSELAMQLVRGGRRLFINGKETRETRKFLASFAAVAFHPGTMQVIKGGPASRRYLVDRGIMSLQPDYAMVSQDLQRVLKQRNALVRTVTHEASDTLATWTEQLIDLGVRVTYRRQEHIEQLNSTLHELIGRLGEDLGTLTLEYQPAVLRQCALPERREILTANDDGAQLRHYFQAEARRLRRAEEATGQSLFGPQRDDVIIHYRGRQSRGYTSQGEQRLAAFLLVAALAVDIYRTRGYRPVVLLDDVVSELDERNRMVVFDFLKTHAFQVFITDVEERPLYRDLSPLTPLQVRQVGGKAAFQRGAAFDHTPGNGQ